MNSVTYRAIENGDHTYDLEAIDGAGFIIARVEDVTTEREYAENIAWIFTKNHMLPLHLEQVAAAMVGILL